MSQAAPIQVARWALKAGWRTPNSQVAIAVSLAQGADPAAPGGAWGVGGPAGDGQGQANAAFAQWKTQGWDEFPAWRTGSWRLYMPMAAAAQAAANADALVDKAGDVAAAPVEAATAPLQATAALASYVGTNEFWQRTVKIGLGVALIAIAAVSLAWTTTARPFFQSVGILDTEVDRAVQKLALQNQVRGTSP
jgi:hypothetical protein